MLYIFNIGFYILYTLNSIIFMNELSSLHVHGEHKAAWVTISTDEYESLLATLETLSNSKAMEKISQGEKDRLEGKIKDFDKVKKELGF